MSKTVKIPERWVTVIREEEMREAKGKRKRDDVNADDDAEPAAEARVRAHVKIDYASTDRVCNGGPSYHTLDIVRRSSHLPACLSRDRIGPPLQRLPVRPERSYQHGLQVASTFLCARVPASA
jgi:hypothetical protein